MKKSPLYTSIAIAIFLFCQSDAQADLVTEVVFDTSFASADGYVDGAANVQAGFTETQGGYSISDAAGTGVLSQAAGGFQRAQIGPSNAGQTVAVGDMILFETTGYTLTAGTNNARANIGLSGGGTAGAAQLAIGSQLSVDATGNIFVENGAFGVDTAGRVDTGFDVGQTFDYGVKLTAETATGIEAATYTVDHLINGVSLLNETGQTLNIVDGASPTFLMGFVQDQGNSAAFSIDGITISTVGVAVPEPNSLVAIAVLGLVGFTRRRR